jgi:hypothetical protein
MAYFNDSLQIAVNHNNIANLKPVEFYVSYPPRATPVSKGVRTVTGSGKQRFGGGKTATWEWGFMSFADLESLVTAIVGGWTTENTDVTIRTYVRGSTYAYYNATLHTPFPRSDDTADGDFVQETTEKLTEVRLRFTKLTAL